MVRCTRGNGRRVCILKNLWPHSRDRALRCTSKYARAKDLSRIRPTGCIQIVQSLYPRPLCLCVAPSRSEVAAGSWELGGMYRDMARRVQQPLKALHLMRHDISGTGRHTGRFQLVTQSWARRKGKITPSGSHAIYSAAMICWVGWWPSRSVVCSCIVA